VPRLASLRAFVNMPTKHAFSSWAFATLVGGVIWLTAGCSLRTVPPIRFVPLLGAEKTIDTTDLLMRALKDRDRAVRAEAVDLLGVLGQSGDNSTKKKVAQILGMAMKDRDPGLRVQIVQKLGEMEARYANRYLINALKDPHPFVRAEVITVINNRERGNSGSQPGAATSALITP